MSYRPRFTNHAKGVQRLADTLRRYGTAAEKELDRILNEVNGGALRGRYQREWAYGGRWIVDFYFREVRLGVEVDGPYHHSLRQQLHDIARELALEKAGITIVRVSNDDVFGDREALLHKLRKAWRQARTAARQVLTAKPAQKRRALVVASPKPRTKKAPEPYAGGWTSIKQGVTRPGDATNKSFIDEGIAGSRNENRAMRRQQSAEMRKRSRGE